MKQTETEREEKYSQTNLYRVKQRDVFEAKLTFGSPLEPFAEDARMFLVYILESQGSRELEVKEKSSE